MYFYYNNKYAKIASINEAVLFCITFVGAYENASRTRCADKAALNRDRRKKAWE